MPTLIIHVLLLLASLPGGSGATDTVTQLPHSLGRYHHFTNQAARAIYVNDFEGASVAYDSAFKYRKQPYYVDLKNYILVNHKTGQYGKNALPLFHLLTNKKMDSTQVFRELPHRVFNADNLAIIRKLSRAHSKSGPTDPALEKALRTMWASDQAVRNYTLDKNNKQGWEAMYAARDSTNVANFMQFEKLVGQLGFPTEEKTGVFYDDAHTWADIISTLLLHFRLSKNETTSTRATALINTVLQNGQLHPAVAASILDRFPLTPTRSTPEFNFMSSTVHVVLDKPYRPFVFYNDRLMREVNTNRIAIGLDSFHITQKQVVCQYFGAQALSDTTIIAWVPYATLDELPPGLVNQSVKDAKVDILDYRINTTAILEECACQQKAY